MRAYILAAGKGTRLGELTKDTPKPMLEVGGKPVLEHIVSRLEEVGLEVWVKVSYLQEQIKDYFGNRVKYVESDQNHLEFVRERYAAEKPYFVVNGDTLSNVNYKNMIELQQKYPDTIVELVDEWRCAGTWLYPVYQGITTGLVFPYRQKDLIWFDIGTPERLEEARNAFAH